jgi:hypothetical protein
MPVRPRLIRDPEERDQPPNNVPAPVWISIASTIKDIPPEELTAIVRSHGKKATIVRYRWNRAHARSRGEVDLWNEIIAVISRMDEAALPAPTLKELLHDMFQMEVELDRIRARQQQLLDLARTWDHNGVLDGKIQSLRGMMLLLDVSLEAFERSLEALLSHPVNTDT